MPKIAINLLGFNHREKIGAAIESVLAQSFSDFELWYTDNASADGSAEFVRKHYPQITVIENRENLGYAGGHNIFFHLATAELAMVLNPDVVLDRDFLKNIVPVFSEEKVGAATGKLLKPLTLGGEKIIDGTGIVVSLTRRGRERGQNEEDLGQYDDSPKIFGVSGTAAVYRKSALEKIKVPGSGGHDEYFDEDFFAYWEDFDLSWRLRLAGFSCRFAPAAIGYHERVAGSSPGGYKKIKSFIKHHNKLPLQVKRWNWKNHLFCLVKNDFNWPFWLGLPFIFARELGMLVFILLFERETLSAWREARSQFPAMLKKRQFIKSLQAVGGRAMAGWFLGKYD